MIPPVRFAALLLLSLPAFAQHPSESPAASRLLFQPLRASPVEARMGAIIHADDRRLRLDIGNSVDLLHGDVSAFPGASWAFGADFFTWTALRRDADFHFPVDAVDYLFGVNASLRIPYQDQLVVEGRLRLSHISAHLVDGSFDKRQGQWRDGRLPIVYSREFLDLTVAMRLWDVLRPYIGLQYIYHVDPPDLGAMSLQAGCEVMTEAVSGIHPFAAYDLRLSRITVYSAAHSVHAGVKLGPRVGPGLALFLAAWSGHSEHGEYYDLRRSWWGAGFVVDF